MQQVVLGGVPFSQLELELGFFFAFGERQRGDPASVVFEIHHVAVFQGDLDVRHHRHVVFGSSSSLLGKLLIPK